MGSVLAMMAIAALLACGAAVAATISGDAGANEITGTENIDTLYGYGGDDTISGGSAADRIYGGDGNDELFGTDEYQSGINDGEQTSIDGNDRIEGEKGDDVLVGASGADTLRGGPGADTIIEGPVNDAAQDTIEADPTYFSGEPPPDAGAWNDKINVASAPARKDNVNCGPGIDEVQADSLDVVNANCENVEVISPTVSVMPSSAAESAAADDNGTEIPPKVTSTEAFPEEAVDPMTGDDGNIESPYAEGEASSARRAGFSCYTAPWFRGATYCTRAYLDVGMGWGLVVLDTNPDRWIYYEARYTFLPDASGFLHRRFDLFDAVDS